MKILCPFCGKLVEGKHIPDSIFMGYQRIEASCDCTPEFWVTYPKFMLQKEGVLIPR